MKKGKKLFFIYLFILLFLLFFLYIFYLDLNSLLFIVLLLLLIVFYKFIGHKTHLLTPLLDDINIIDSRVLAKESIILMFSSSIFKKYKILYDIIFFAYFILFPWNWMTYIVIYIYSKIFGVKVWINGNKDIFFKKYFNIDTRNVNLWSDDSIFIIIFNWTVKYPILRFLFIPMKMRSIIFSLKDYNLFYFLYCILLFYIIYLNFIADLLFFDKILLIYICMSFVWPLMTFIYIEIFDKHENIFFNFHPNISFYLLNDYNSLTWRLFGLYIEAVNEMNNNYLFHKYGFFNSALTAYCSEIVNISNESLKYEKNYGVSFFAYRVLIIYINTLQIYSSFYYLGNNINFIIENYKYWLILLMDMRRLIGYDKKDWMLWPKYFYISALKFSNKNLWEILVNDLNELICIPKEFVLSNKLYNNLLLNTIFLYSKVLEDYKINNIKYTFLFYDYKHKVKDENRDINEEDDFISSLDLSNTVDEEFFENIHQEVEEYYFKEYEKLEDKNVLISNKQLDKIKKIIKDEWNC